MKSQEEYWRGEYEAAEAKLKEAEDANARLNAREQAYRLKLKEAEERHENALEAARGADGKIIDALVDQRDQRTRALEQIASERSASALIVDIAETALEDSATEDDKPESAKPIAKYVGPGKGDFGRDKAYVVPENSVMEGERCCTCGCDKYGGRTHAPQCATEEKK